MNAQNPPFELQDTELHHLYDKHRLHGLVDDMDFALFKDELTALLQDPLTLIFRILPKSPKIANAFFKSLSDEEFDMISGLATLTGYVPQNFPIDLNPAICADLRLEERCELSFLSAFDESNVDLFELIDDAMHYYRQKFDVEDVEALNDEEQLCLLRHLTFSPDKLEGKEQKQHQKLVFGLHIPAAYKAFHRSCIDELTTRILISPVYAGIFEAIFEKETSEANDMPYLTSDKDKDVFCSILMGEMAQIWGIPTPIRKDFDQKQELDENGKPFVAIMHAYYRSKADQDHTSGLYYGFNKETGALKRQSYFELQAMCHEFGHMMSLYLTKARSNKKIMDAFPHLKTAPILSLSTHASAFAINSPNIGHRRYYPQLGTDFSGLPKPYGKSEYKGQIEERHADWLGKEISEAIETALLARRCIRNLDLAKQEIEDQFTPIMHNLKLGNKAPELMRTVQDNLRYADDFPALIEATRTNLKTLKSWYKANVNEAYERAFQINNALDTSRIITTPSLLARDQMRDLKITSEDLSHCYALYSACTGFKNKTIRTPLPTDQNELSLSA